MQMSSETFMAYWLGYVGPGNTLQQTLECVDVVALAFGVTAPGNTVTTDFLTSAHSKEEILEGVRFLQSRGQKVVMSINGNPHWPGHPFGWENLNPEEFATNVRKVVMEEWGLDGVDLDNEGAYAPTPSPDGNFVQVIKALRATLGPEARISLPVYLGPGRDAYLKYVKEEIDYVYTMAYWNNYDGQISLLKQYQSLVGDDKAGIGVAEAANPGQNTPFDIVPKLSQYTPKAGMMLWTLNSTEAEKWSETICDNMPS